MDASLSSSSNETSRRQKRVSELAHRAVGAAAGVARPGLYGFALALDGLDEGIAGWFSPAPEDWPELRVRRTVEPAASLAGVISSSPEPELEMDGHSALVRMPDGSATMTRGTREVRFRTRAALGIDELVHPMLGHAALAFAHWLGREAFHAGVFLAGGRAWALLGRRGSGKSSTLAWLARRGQPIVADDLLVLDGRTAFVGPRTLDLEPSSAAHLGWGESLEHVRAGTRRRLALEPLAPEHRLAGWVSLAWGEQVGVRSVPPAERIPLLVEHGHHPLGEANWSSVLALASLPTFELTRPRRLQSLEQAGELLLATIAAAGGPA